MRNYRELEVWEKSHKLTLELYRMSRAFPKEELYGLTSQMRRAAVSIGANLAEGCGRRTSPELARFVRIAMGSASELDYHLLLCLDFSFITSEEYEQAAKELTRIRKMLSGLLASIESQLTSKASAAQA
ncbi:MAG TPA: four helix bundle protein [Candidatus Angelobacter sp.]|nr:four helix bundle protein [Candidatus Angelobacter sp.]